MRGIGFKAAAACLVGLCLFLAINALIAGWLAAVRPTHRPTIPEPILEALRAALPALAPFKPHPNAVATFLEGAVLLGLVLARRGRGGARLAWGAVTALIGYGLFVSGSRGAWLGLGGAALGWAWLRFPGRGRQLFGLGGVVAVGGGRAATGCPAGGGGPGAGRGGGGGGGRGGGGGGRGGGGGGGEGRGGGVGGSGLKTIRLLQSIQGGPVSISRAEAGW